MSPSEAAEEEPAGGEALLSMLVGSIPFGLLAEDEEKRILYANEVFCGVFAQLLHGEKLVGSNRDEALGDAGILFSDPGGFVGLTEEELTERRPVTGNGFPFTDGRVFGCDHVPVFVGDERRGHATGAIGT